MTVKVYSSFTNVITVVELHCPHCEEIIFIDDAMGEFVCPHCDGEFEWGLVSNEEVDDIPHTLILNQGVLSLDHDVEGRLFPSSSQVFSSLSIAGLDCYLLGRSKCPNLQETVLHWCTTCHACYLGRF